MMAQVKHTTGAHLKWNALRRLSENEGIATVSSSSSTTTHCVGSVVCTGGIHSREREEAPVGHINTRSQHYLSTGRQQILEQVASDDKTAPRAEKTSGCCAISPADAPVDRMTAPSALSDVCTHDDESSTTEEESEDEPSSLDDTAGPQDNSLLEQLEDDRGSDLEDFVDVSREQNSLGLLVVSEAPMDQNVTPISMKAHCALKLVDAWKDKVHMLVEHFPDPLQPPLIA